MKKTNQSKYVIVAIIVASLCAAIVTLNYFIGRSTASKSSSEKSGSTQNATLLFVGDIMVHLSQINTAKRNNGYDFKPSFEFVKGQISQADLAIGNLETTLSGAEHIYTGYPRFNSPDELADALKHAGFDILTTTNNHSMDRHFSGIKRTLQQLDKRFIGHFGTYATLQNRNKVFVKDVDGIKIAFISWTYGTNGIAIDDDKQWSVAQIKQDEVIRDIQLAKDTKADLIVAMPHMGTEYSRHPSKEVRDFTSLLLAHGVNIVILSHPHVVQHFEFKNGKFIAWSMGNFISGQRPMPRDMGVILEIYIEKNDNSTKICDARVTPTWVQIKKNDGGKTSRVLPLLYAIQHPTVCELRWVDMLRLQLARRDFEEIVLCGNATMTEDNSCYVVREVGCYEIKIITVITLVSALLLAMLVVGKN